jgi:hypothetical protein
MNTHDLIDTLGTAFLLLLALAGALAAIAVIIA